MDGETQGTLEFEFGIVGEQLELSDDESILLHVAIQASNLDFKALEDASFAAWGEDKVCEFQSFLDDLFKKLQPSIDDHESRVSILAWLSSVTEQMDRYRGARIYAFGSFESNLYTRWADLDLSLELPDTGVWLQGVSKRTKAKVLESFWRILIRKGEAHDINFIPSARVPVIMFKDSQHNISCDISVSNDGILKSCLLRAICEVDPRCRQLIFLVKFWAKVHGINDPKLGTLNSFALCLLVVFHLQTISPPVLPPLSSVLDKDTATHFEGAGRRSYIEEVRKNIWTRIQPFINGKFGSQNKSSVAELFASFIQKFSAVSKLWSEGLAVCTFSGTWGAVSSVCLTWRQNGHVMAIEDPVIRSENCARSVRADTLELIAEAFRSTARVLSSPMVAGGLPALLESLFLWPVSTQALGLESWLLKAHSSCENHTRGSVKYKNAVRPNKYPGKKNRVELDLSAHMVKQKREKSHSCKVINNRSSRKNRSLIEMKREVENDVFLQEKADESCVSRRDLNCHEKTSRAQFQHQLQLAPSVPLVRTKVKEKRIFKREKGKVKKLSDGGIIDSTLKKDTPPVQQGKAERESSHEGVVSEGSRESSSELESMQCKTERVTRNCISERVTGKDMMSMKGLSDAIPDPDASSTDPSCRNVCSTMETAEHNPVIREEDPLGTEGILAGNIWAGPMKGCAEKGHPKSTDHVKNDYLDTMQLGSTYETESGRAQQLDDPWPINPKVGYMKGACTYEAQSGRAHQLDDPLPILQGSESIEVGYTKGASTYETQSGRAQQSDDPWPILQGSESIKVGHTKGASSIHVQTLVTQDDRKTTPSKNVRRPRTMPRKNTRKIGNNIIVPSVDTSADCKGAMQNVLHPARSMRMSQGAQVWVPRKTSEKLTCYAATSNGLEEAT
ncbi:hypothetical protein KP509_16G074700 [Ceratopteris richardii]|uniref:Poly(A) RNA polymerase mitochondrial-like central palm domain-containing protein n=1 Tax=Ceratopteris richardii TaxID=49495 RepID=A0A8T2T1X2_CERRI|nr:hypothetical protein KP509_16G074700 [Ceratopteris richardii]KAH7388420.1 hypothetical protein KP509_16G074700 [Ceratopteris richardii]KAH7388421.1 hypothetical protein KP509_16G074700 [Ceratopteris richardii]KAH7388422.1 hypothetical protein KP509_16G074700 [Ceratopteris richardii]KAH7388423.1 hypothetical protein KP509_16G074700 [Ceratopteris richardii]